MLPHHKKTLAIVIISIITTTIMVAIALALMVPSFHKTSWRDWLSNYKEVKRKIHVLKIFFFNHKPHSKALTLLSQHAFVMNKHVWNRNLAFPIMSWNPSLPFLQHFTKKLYRSYKIYTLTRLTKSNYWKSFSSPNSILKCPSLHVSYIS